MLTVSYKKHGIRLAHIWFATDNEANEVYKLKNIADLIFLHGTNTVPDNGVLYTTQHTLIKDLTLSEDELFASLGKHLRKHIRKCEREDNVEIKYYESDEILANQEILKKCKYLYEKLFTDKGMSADFNTKLALEYCKLHALVVAICYAEKKPIGFCAMIIDENDARAWVGAFDFRNSENDSYFMARAHRLFNWQRMIYCKNRGVKRFDFGGINSFDEPNGIAKFKLEFESQNKVTYNNYLVPTNLFGKIALKFFFRKR